MEQENEIIELSDDEEQPEEQEQPQEHRQQDANIWIEEEEDDWDVETVRFEDWLQELRMEQQPIQCPEVSSSSELAEGAECLCLCHT